VAFKQLNAEVPPETLQVFGDRGLADVVGFGGPSHAPLIEDSEEQLQAVQREGRFCHRVIPIYLINII
jgi:hypothetical protein